MINWVSFPKHIRPNEDFKSIVDLFEKNEHLIDSQEFKLSSDEVLATVRPSLEKLNYKVESGKSNSEKIHIPVLFGQNGIEEKAFEADAYNEEKKIIIEVEAGRAVLNYQFLKDFYEACMMCDVDYLCIAVRNIYVNGKAVSKDFEKVKTFFETMYLSKRVEIPLEGILLIGY